VAASNQNDTLKKRREFSTASVLSLVNFDAMWNVGLSFANVQHQEHIQNLAQAAWLKNLPRIGLKSLGQ